MTTITPDLIRNTHKAIAPHTIRTPTVPATRKSPTYECVQIAWGAGQAADADARAETGGCDRM